MSDFAIKAEGLGKKYFLRHQAAGRQYVALRDVLTDKAKSLFSPGKGASGNRNTIEEFWALKDVSFEIKQGEAVGIIGRNGAGKSTLLKLLSRITEPTKGRIRLRGRVASLLEVGTGFHPELTGRENIFLNGAVLGMARAEIKKKFDEIVAFAEVEKFLDTPVKRYSSGMYMRLAFAVAAHLEQEILIVDEVLAVGDLEFQKKCLGKMEDVSKGGRTVLFVSHNMEAVRRMCPRGIVLNQGRVEMVGSIKEAIDCYLKQKASQNPIVDLSAMSRPLPVRLKARLNTVRMAGTDDWSVAYGEQPKFEVDLTTSATLSGFELVTCLLTITGTEITTSLSTHTLTLEKVEPGNYIFDVRYEGWHLMPGRYSLRLALVSTAGGEDYIPRVCEFEVRTSDLSAKHQTDRFEGMLVPTVQYNLRLKKPEGL
jgi:lipopolysaccharide transport system ATP-binding protein